MKGKSLREFIDELYYNPELEFVFDQKHYILSGYINQDRTYTLEMSEIDCNGKKLFCVTNKDRNIVVAQFEQARIFNGKTIYEAENEIEVLYG